MGVREEKAIIRATELRDFDSELCDFEGESLAGVDEVGRGCLAGPVVCACVVLRENYDGIGVDDSKKLSEKKREQLFGGIIENAHAVGIGMVDNDKIDEINILNATKLAMRKAISDAENQMEETGNKISKVLIDAVDIGEMKTKSGETIEIIPIVKGDQKSMAVAAASIVAKVTRDRIMIEMSRKYPEYGFEKNKGYGTKEHYTGIEKAGITEIHRKTFLKNMPNVRER